MNCNLIRRSVPVSDQSHRAKTPTQTSTAAGVTFIVKCELTKYLFMMALNIKETKMK